MPALQQRYGQPRQLVQSELKKIPNAPTVKTGHAQRFEDFAAAVNNLEAVLSTLDGPARAKLQCGSHVDTLLTKLPVSYRDSFIEHCLAQGILMSGTTRTYALPDFAQWLEKKSQAIQISRRVSERVHIDTCTESQDKQDLRRSELLPFSLVIKMTPKLIQNPVSFLPLLQPQSRPKEEKDFSHSAPTVITRTITSVLVLNLPN